MKINSENLRFFIKLVKIFSSSSTVAAARAHARVVRLILRHARESNVAPHDVVLVVEDVVFENFLHELLKCHLDVGVVGCGCLHEECALLLCELLAQLTIHRSLLI